MAQYLEIINKPIFWIICAPAVLFIAVLSLIFYRQAVKAAPVVDLRKEDCLRSMKIGAIAGIGPSLAVFAVMLTLMNSLGGPFTWMRLSIIGSAVTETYGAQIGAAVVGATLGDPSTYDLYAFAASVWTITLNTCGFILFVFLFAHKGEAIKGKIGKKDAGILAIIGLAAILGINGYLAASLSLGSAIGNFVSLIVALLTGLVVQQVAKKHPKILEFNLAISMVVGMVAGQAANMLAA